MEPKRGFFDKINNAFFSVVDVFLGLLEDRGWNIPEETRFLYHTAIFVYLFWLGFPIILQYFAEFEILVLVMAIASFCIANIMPIRRLFGYYSSEEKVHGIVNRIKNNQISIKQVAEHLHKNLLPPHLSLSIIKAYQEKGQGLPPEIIRAIIRQPQEINIFEEIIKEQLNESDFSLLMRKYMNRVPKPLLLKTVESQKMNWLTVKDMLFYQENAYQIINDIGKKADDETIMDFVIAEKHNYKQKMLRKNFLRNHHAAVSLGIATLAAAPSMLLFTETLFIAASFTVLWLLVFELLYNYGPREPFTLERDGMLYFATGNNGKFQQVSHILKEYGVEVEQKPLSLQEPESDSLKKIALSKANQAFGKIKMPLIVEDTGFYLEAYKGFPGTNPKWVFQKIGFEGFFKLLSGKSKNCYFHTVICFMESPNQFKFFEGKWLGKVTAKISKKQSPNLPYSRIFVPQGEKVPSVEMPLEKKSKVSQRAIASHALGEWLKEKSLNDLIDSI